MVKFTNKKIINKIENINIWAKQCGIVKWNYVEQNQSSKNVCGFYFVAVEFISLGNNKYQQNNKSRHTDKNNNNLSNDFFFVSFHFFYSSIFLIKHYFCVLIQKYFIENIWYNLLVLRNYDKDRT